MDRDAITITYLDAAFDRMLGAARRSGRALNDRPAGDSTNSVASLVIHCVEVVEFWLGHVGLGRPSSRDRDAEFTRRATLGQLERLVAERRTLAAQDVRALTAGAGQPSELRQFVLGGPSDEALVLHVIEELFQHVGHMELAVDALRRRGAVGQPVFHLALAAEWTEAVRSGGPYTRSTVGRSLDEEGFIHCSFEDQLAATAARFYAGRTDVLVLELSESLEAQVRVEAPEGSEEAFPHLYGPLPLDQVVSVRPLRWPPTAPSGGAAR